MSKEVFVKRLENSSMMVRKFKLKDNQINAYLDKELKNAANEKDVGSIDYNHPLKRLNCGTISTHFQDDEPCFKIGFIDEKVDI